MKVQRVEQLDGGVRRVDGHVGRRLEQRLGVVEDDLHARPRRDRRPPSALASAGTASTPTTTLCSRTSSGSRSYGSTETRPIGCPTFCRIGVDDGGDVDPVLGEDRGRGDRLAEPAGPDERDVVLALRAEDLPDHVEQELDRVADAALAELPEVERSRRICVALMFVYSAISCDEMRVFPIFRACVSTWRYRDRRAATPTFKRSATRPP